MGWGKIKDISIASTQLVSLNIYIFFPPKSYLIVLLLPEKYRDPDCTPTKGILSNHIKNVLLKMITNVSTNETKSKKYRKYRKSS